MHRLPLGLRFVLAAVLLSRPVISAGEEVMLKNGTVLNGSIVQMTETDITVDTADMGQVIVKRRTVQSITDGGGMRTPLPPSLQSVSPKESVDAVPSNSGVNQTVNVNTNSNSTPSQSTTNSQPAGQAASPAKEDKAAVATAVIADSEVPRWFGHFGYGLGSAIFESELYHNTTFRAPTLRWAPLGYQFASGLSVDVFGEGMQSQRRKSMSHQLIQLGGEIGWSSNLPSRGQSGSLFRAGLSLSRTELRTEFASTGREKSYPGDWDGNTNGEFKEPLNVGPNGGAIVSKGIGVGLSATYAYTFNDGFGLELTGAAAQATITDDMVQGEIGCDLRYGGQYRVGGCAKDWKGSVSFASLTGGITYRF